MANEKGIDDVVRKGQLLDLYGALLTERQRVCMHLYFDMNLSFSEIAEELDVSRQSVFDMLRRTSKALEQYEDRLGILAQNQYVAEQLRQAVALLDGGAARDEAQEILHRLVRMIDE